MTAAYAFLFDGSADGLPEPQLPLFTAAVFDAVAHADPNGAVVAQFRIGLPSLTSFAERTIGVHGTTRGSGRTVSHDTDMYKYVVWDWLDSLAAGWSSVDPAHAQRVFLRHTYECVALSALSEDVRDQVDTQLKAVPGYVGGFAIDPGNPVHRGGFFDLLIYDAAIVGGTVIQDRTIEGDEDWALEGAATFRPGGLVWQDYGWLRSHGPPGLPKEPLSARGEQAASAVARKYAPSVEQRVLEEMTRAFFLNASRKTFAFEQVGQSADVLEALMPEGKFTHYLFDRAHKDGKSKAAFLIDELEIDAQDWRYLAAQFYFGLAMAEPAAVKLNEWQTGYGARFDVEMRVRNRVGKTVVIGTGWNMNPGALPSLSTAFPGDRTAAAVEPGDVPVLLPGVRTDADWAQLWAWASAAGMRAAETLVPTPMYLVGMSPISEGEVGSAQVRIADARRGFARWLLQHGPGQRDGYGGAVVASPVASQSVERAMAWARAVALTLHLNGLAAAAESFKN